MPRRAAPPQPLATAGLLNSFVLGLYRSRASGRDRATGRFVAAEGKSVASMLGRLGGHRGGKRVAAAMTPEQRRERARKGGLARAASLNSEQRRTIAGIGARCAHAAHAKGGQ